MSRGKRAFSVGAIALAIAFAFVAGASALTMSNGVAATDERAPEAPTDLVTNVDLGVPAVDLSWAASPSDAVRQAPVGTDFTSAGTFVNVNDVAAYNIWRSDGGAYELLGAADGTTYSDETVVSGLTYTYQVKAADAGGNESVALESSPISLGPPPSTEVVTPPTAAPAKRVRMVLGGTFPTPEFRTVFIHDFRRAVGRTLSISYLRVRVRDLIPGSIVVDFTIDEDATGTEPTSSEAIADLETQVAANPAAIAEAAVAEGATTTFEAVQTLSSSDVIDVDFGEVAIDGAPSETFTFTNTATDPEANLTVNASVTGTGFAVTPATLSLAIGESGSIEVSFSAADVGNMNGSYAGTLTVRSNDPENAQTDVVLTADIVDGLDLPVLDLSGVALQFGSVLVDGSSTKEVTVTNKGDLDLEATVTLAGDASFTIDADSLLLAGGEAAIINVVFSPAATGAASGTITIASNAAVDATKVVQLNGNGVAELAGPKIGINAAGEQVMGFLDDDTDVDFDDFFAFADVFGTGTGDPTYNVQADFDESGIIDFDDFFIFADNFGEIAVSFLN